jgi:photosystem II stability/assembly factor-like uncharacterized protein
MIFKFRLLSIALLVFTIPAQLLAQCSNLTWHNPNPQSNDLSDIEFLTDSIVLAIGERGVLIRSEDAGLTWNVLPQLPYYDYKSFFFTDSLTGYACGSINNAGIIIKTIDGGLHWNILEESGPTGIGSTQSIWFTSDSVGYCGSFKKILKTTDAGETWSETNFSANTSHYDIEFINDSVGFSAAGDKLYRTINAGNTWSQVLVDSENSIRYISFANDTIGFVSTYSSEVYRTTNAGATWTLFGVPFSWVVDAMQFVNDSTGFVACGSNTLYYRTTDSGASWALVQNPNWSSEVRAFAANTSGDVVAVGQNGLIFQSSQYGNLNTWTNRVEGNQYALRCLDMIDSNTGFFAGPGYILKTTDACETLLPTAISNTNFPNAIHFPTSDFGYIVGSAGLRYRTIDAGATWQNLSITTTQNTYGLYFLDDQNGFMCGDGGAVQKTTNGGTTWTSLATGLASYLRDVYFMNPDTGFVCGASGTLKKTVDGGATWTNIPTGTTGFLLKIHFANDSLGFCSGESGILLRTTNGGNTWILNLQGWGDDITDVQFVNDLEGYFVISDFNGAIYRTWDGGLTWPYYGIVNNSGIEEIDAVDGNAVFGIGGYYGALWEFNPAIPAPDLPDSLVVCQGAFVQSNVPSGYNARWMMSNTFASIISNEDSLDTSLLTGDTIIWLHYRNELCESIHKPIFIDVQVRPDAPQIFASDVALCEGEITSITTSTNEPVFWSNGDISITTEINSSGSYYAIAGNVGCQSVPSDTIGITVFTTPDLPVVNVLPYNPCSSSIVTMGAESVDQLQWFDSDQNQLSAFENIFVTDVLSSTTIFYASAISPEGCESNQVQISIPFVPTPPAPVITTLAEVVCENETTVLTVEDTYPAFWSNDSTGNSITAGAGTYSVYYTNDGCQSDTAQIIIEEIIVPTPLIEASTLIFCEGDSAILSTQPLFDLFWSTDETSASIEVETSGLYSVYYINEMCQGDPAEIAIEVSTLPETPVVDEIFDAVTYSLFTTAGWTNYDWYFMGELLPYHEAQIPTDFQMGNYQVVVYNEEGCSSSSEIYYFNYFGMEEENSVLIIYPNPASDLLIVDMGDISTGECRIWDSTGKLVYGSNKLSGSGHYNIDISNMPCGIYTFEIFKEDSVVWRSRFVKI